MVARPSADRKIVDSNNIEGIYFSYRNFPMVKHSPYK